MFPLYQAAISQMKKEFIVEIVSCQEFTVDYTHAAVAALHPSLP